MLQVAAIISIAALSWRYVENPIRHGALKRVWARLRGGGLQAENVSRRAWALAAATAAVFVTACLGAVGAGVGTSPAVGEISVAETVTTADLAADAERASCDSVIHIGDSTSEGLVSRDYQPNRDKLISARYGQIGATTQHLEVSGARSIYERYNGLPNAQDVAADWKRQGFEGCWVLALGTNEAANVAAGSAFGFDQRIRSMMSTIGEQPVLWVNVKSLVTSGPYASNHMEAWDAALLEACNQYPNMRIYDWASDVEDSWFTDDDLHFTTPGYAARGRLIADALLDAFPESIPLTPTDSSNCVIHPDGQLPESEQAD